MKDPEPAFRHRLLRTPFPIPRRGRHPSGPSRRSSQQRHSPISSPRGPRWPRPSPSPPHYPPICMHAVNKRRKAEPGGADGGDGRSSFQAAVEAFGDVELEEAAAMLGEPAAVAAHGAILARGATRSWNRSPSTTGRNGRARGDPMAAGRDERAERVLLGRLVRRTMRAARGADRFGQVIPGDMDIATRTVCQGVSDGFARFCSARMSAIPPGIGRGQASRKRGLSRHFGTA